MEQRTTRVNSIAEFGERFGCAITALPGNVALVGWSAADGRWHCGPARAWRARAFDRVGPTIAFFDAYVLPRLSGRSFWFMLCFWDGWRERQPYADRYAWVPAGDLDGREEWQGDPGELPVLSPGRRWIACYGAHRGDPGAALLPEAHYLMQAGYAGLFDEVERSRLPWAERTPRAILCAGDHGEAANYFPPAVAGRAHPRRDLRQLVDASGLAVDVHLGEGVPRAEQMSRKWILDVDGYTRTWDAFAWKIRSGSTVLVRDSPWETFFSRRFEPWAHFVPVAHDFSDLAERLAWCGAHDDECRQIAERARRRAMEVYRAEYVIRAVARQWRSLAAARELIGA